MQESCFGLDLGVPLRRIPRAERVSDVRPIRWLQTRSRGVRPDVSRGTRVLRLVGVGVSSHRDLDLGCAA